MTVDAISILRTSASFEKQYKVYPEEYYSRGKGSFIPVEALQLVEQAKVQTAATKAAAPAEKPTEKVTKTPEPVKTAVKTVADSKDSTTTQTV